MAMKKFLTFFTIAFVLALTFSTWGFAFGQEVAVADEEISYIYISPADLENNEFAGDTQIAVKDKMSGDLLFYLIESYYYPVHKNPLLNLYYELNIDGVDGLVEIATLAEAPKSYENVSLENALPGNILLKDGVTIEIGGNTIDTRDGWTVKLVGVNGDSFFVVASKDTVVVSGLALKESFTSSTVAYHPIDLAIREGMLTETPEVEEPTITDTDKSTILRIVLIIGIAIPAIIIAVMIFKPGRASARSNYDRHAMRTRRDEEIDYDRDRSYDRERDYSRRAPYDDREYRDRYERRDERRDDRRDDYYRDDRRAYDDRGYDRPRDDRDYDRGYSDRGYDDRRYNVRDYNGRDYNDRGYDDRNGRR